MKPDMDTFEASLSSHTLIGNPLGPRILAHQWTNVRTFSRGVNEMVVEGTSEVSHITLCGGEILLS